MKEQDQTGDPTLRDGVISPRTGKPRDVERDRVRLSLKHRMFGEAEPQLCVGRYLILDTIGEGGMGVVYRARDPDLDRTVAIKVVRADTGEEDRSRLRREAQALAKLSHPNIVEVYEVGEENKQVFIAMEFVDGVSLRTWQKRPGRTLDEIIEMYVEAGRGLVAAHKMDLVHRDFKSENVIVGPDQRPRVLDFGLARHEAILEELEAEETLSNEFASGRLTQTGAVMGTPAYMSPEQHAGREVGPESDQFSFCVSLYEALYGVHPYPSETVYELTTKALLGEVDEPPTMAKVPREIRRALLKGLRPQPAERYRSMTSLLRALRRHVRKHRDRRRWINAATVTGVVAVASLLAIGPYNPLHSSCGTAKEPLAGVWDDEARAEMKRAFAATDLPYAKTSATRVSAILDQYGARWIETRDAACDSTEETLDLTMACLATRRDALQRLVESLRSAQPRLVDASVTAALDLPDPTTCATIENAVALPVDAEARARVVELRDDISQVQSFSQTARIAEALSLARETTAASDELGYEPVQAEAWAALGDAHDRAGDYAAAETALQRAFDLGRSCGHDDVAARAATQLVYVVGVSQSRFQDGIKWGGPARAYRERAKLPVVPLESYLGRIASSQGKLDEAEARLVAAVELGEQLWGLDDPRLASPLTHLGRVKWQRAQLPEARAIFDRALAIVEAELGPGHPNTATLLTALAGVAVKESDFARGRTLMLRALEINQATLGAEHPKIAATLENLGAVAGHAGDYEEAGMYFERAVSMHVKIHGEDHPTIAKARSNLGQLYKKLGRIEDARRQHETALAISEKHFGTEHPESAMSHLNIGQTLYETGEFEESIRHAEIAAKIFRAAGGDDHPEIGNALIAISSAQTELGQVEKALQNQKRAVAIWTKVYGPDHFRVAMALANLGTTSLELGDLTGALEHLTESMRIVADHEELGHADVAFPLLGLCRVERARRNYATAVDYCERGLRLRVKAGIDADYIAEAQIDLAKALWDQGEQRDRALSLAHKAEQTLEASGAAEADTLERLRAWLSEISRRR